jgi:hypothetical protein
VACSAGADGLSEQDRESVALDILPHGLALAGRVLGARLGDDVAWRVGAGGRESCASLANVGDSSVMLAVSMRAQADREHAHHPLRSRDRPRQPVSRLRHDRAGHSVPHGQGGSRPFVEILRRRWGRRSTISALALLRWDANLAGRRELVQRFHHAFASRYTVTSHFRGRSGRCGVGARDNNREAGAVEVDLRILSSSEAFSVMLLRRWRSISAYSTQRSFRIWRCVARRGACRRAERDFGARIGAVSRLLWAGDCDPTHPSGSHHMQTYEARVRVYAVAGRAVLVAWTPARWSTIPRAVQVADLGEFRPGRRLPADPHRSSAKVKSEVGGQQRERRLHDQPRALLDGQQPGSGSPLRR